MKIHDITPLMSSMLAVFPGDQPFESSVALDFKKGDNLLLTSIKMSTHIGAHADGPNHYHPEGFGIDQRPLEIYFGPAQVIEVRLSRGERIRPEMIKNKKILTERILFKTKSFPDPNKWNDDFNSLSKELVEYLATKKVKLVGIDTPSIDLCDDKILESHQAVYKTNMAILEGIVLDNIAEGVYFLTALPLKIKGGDSGPVRAALIEGELNWK